MAGSLGRLLAECDQSFLVGLVGQLSQAGPGAVKGPERALMAALLYDGVQAYVAYAMAKGRAKRARYREAFNWVNTPDWDYVFGFDNVCECLGIDPDFLRDGLGSIANTRDFEWTRSRRVM